MLSWVKKTINEVKDTYGIGLMSSMESFTKPFNKLFIDTEFFNENFFEGFEEMLIESDVLPNIAIQIRQDLEKKIFSQHAKKESFLNAFREVLLENVIDKVDHNFKIATNKKNIILIMGVNGVGKTTTIAKLASYLKNQDIMLAAGDTFRAGAIEQLTVWAERLSIPIVKTHIGHDPAAVIYDAITKMKSDNKKILICDTAGRLHNKTNLMAELSKINKIIKTGIPESESKNIIVIDGTIGKNSVDQVRAFSDITKIDGIIVSKMDAKAKVGLILNLIFEFELPIYFLGVGERVEDLVSFSPVEYFETLVQGFKNE